MLKKSETREFQWARETLMMEGHDSWWRLCKETKGNDTLIVMHFVSHLVLSLSYSGTLIRSIHIIYIYNYAKRSR